MNKSLLRQVSVIYVLVLIGVVGLDLIPERFYIFAVAPAIIFHAWLSTSKQREWTTTVDEEMPEAEEAWKHEETILVDEEFEEEFELSIGGEVALEGWNEHVVPIEEVEEGEVFESLTFEDRTNVKKFQFRR